MITKIFAALIILIALVIGYMVYKNGVLPSYLGVTNGEFSEMPSTPNAVSSQTSVGEKKVLPIAFDDFTSAKKGVLTALKQMGGNKVVTNNDDYLHIVFTTPTMKYKDDVEIYFDTRAGVIHYRSQSRVGYSDKGLNHQRYEKFVAAYKNTDK